MIELIYEKSLLSKVKIVKKILESNGTVNKAELVNIINTSVITLEKYLNELLVELPENSIIFEKDIITINPRKCNLYDVKILYLSQSIIKDILKLMFSEKNYSLENMAQKLYISHSKLFKVLKHMDENFKEINIRIIKKPSIKIIGDEEAILAVYNLLLHLEKKPLKHSFISLNEKELYANVEHFLKKNHIRTGNMIVKECCLWVITVISRKFLKTLFTNKLSNNIENYLSENSLIIHDLKNNMKYIGTQMEDTDYKLLVIFILYNTVGLHFENAEYEKEFYTNKLNVNYRYKNIILSLLLKNHSQINFESIQVITAKLEGSLNFFPLLYPYYRLYQESLVSKKLENQNHKDLIEIIEFDVASTDELHLEGNHKKIDLYKYLTFILSDFLKKQDRQKVYRIGIYSRKGVIFEQQLAVDLKKSIEILPYYDYEINENNENTGNIDLLLVDDLRLLSEASSFKDYLILDEQIFLK